MGDFLLSLAKLCSSCAAGKAAKPEAVYIGALCRIGPSLGLPTAIRTVFLAFMALPCLIFKAGLDEL